MKTLLISLVIVLLLFACKENSQKIEVIENYDKEYLPESEVTVPAVPVDESFNDEMKETFKNIVEKLEQEKEATASVYSFSYRLYISENGKIEKIKSIKIDLPEGRVYSPQSDITKLLIPEMEKWKFDPATLSGKNVKYRKDLNVYLTNWNGKPRVELADKIVDMGNFDMDFNGDDYLVKVDEMPMPVGGIKAIQEKIVYPEKAKNEGVEGKVFVSAFINENGTVDHVKLLKGIGYGCDKAAINAVTKTKFTPGKLGGKPVKVQVSIPIVFKLG